MSRHSEFNTIRRVDGSASAGDSVPAVIPVPRCEVSIRIATMEDFPFIDQLQKLHSHMVGWLPAKAIEKNISDENVLIAEEGTEASRDQGIKGNSGSETLGASVPHASVPTPLGYCIYKDQYMKRDDVGIVYQLNVMPLVQRNLIGAMLVKGAFERAAYGCKLFCCWCAQDIRANYFWESIGFVPLAFRTGSRGKQRIHIFWQRRIRAGDETTPWWFPYQTQAGAVREDRIVLPIPPETHWRDAKPLVLPELEQLRQEDDEQKALPQTLPGGAPVRARPEQPKLSAAQRAAIKRSQSAHLRGVPAGKKAILTGSGIKYVDREDYVPELDAPDELLEQEQAKKKKKRTTAPKKHDPALTRKVRELRDRYLEGVNEQGLLPEGWTDGKYNVSRLPGSVDESPQNAGSDDDIRFLDAA